MTTLPKLVILCIFVHLVAALPLKVLSPRQVPNAVNKVTCQILGVKLAVSALNPEEMDILRGCEDTHSNFAQQSRISASGVGSGAGAGHGGASGAGGSREGVSRAAAGPVRNNASSTSGTTTTAGTKSINANNPSYASTPAGDLTSATPNHSTGAAAGANPSANSSANTRVGSNAIPGSSSEAPTRGPATANDSAVTATQNNDLSSSDSEANTTNADRRVNPLRLNPGEPAASTGPPSGPSTDGPASAVSLASADPTGDAGSAADPHEDSSAAPASGPTVEGDSSSAESSVSSSAAHGDSASAGPSVSTPTAPGGSVSAAPPTSNAPASDSSVSAAASEQPASAPATPDPSSSLNAAANPSSNSGTSPSSQSQSGAHQVSTSSHSSTPSHAGGGGSAAGGGRSAFQMDSVRNRPNAASIANDRAAAAQNRGGLSSLSLLGGDVTKSPSEFTPSRGVTNGVEDSAAGGATSVANSAARCEGQDVNVCSDTTTDV